MRKNISNMKNKGHPNVDICAYIRETVGVRGGLNPIINTLHGQRFGGQIARLGKSLECTAHRAN